MHTLARNNQNGMALVLAMFMLALLSMIGLASMMTTTTDIEIASGERQHLETFYRAQAAHTIAGELLIRTMWDRGFEGFETMASDGTLVDVQDLDDFTFAFRVIDPDFLQEPEDSIIKTTPAGRDFKVWDVNDQFVDQLPCPPAMTAAQCKELDTRIGTQDIDLWTDIRLITMDGDQEVVLADIDIDRIRVRQMAGGGAEFGAKDLGVGAQVSVINYNVDVRARTESGDFYRTPSRQALGFRIVR